MMCATPKKTLTKEQRERLEKVLHILKTDPNLTLIEHEYFYINLYDENGNKIDYEDILEDETFKHVNLNKCCAVGLLVREMNKEAILSLLEFNNEALEELDANILNALSRYYGLTLDQLNTLQKLNDSAENYEDDDPFEIRKQVIIAYLEEILGK